MLGGLALIARGSSVAQWSALGVGGSFGGFASLIALFGWRFVGPTYVARSDADRRRSIYAQSLADRMMLLLLLCIPLIVATALTVAPSGRVIGIAMALATSLNGVTAVWFAVGTGSPWYVFGSETVPKMIGTLIGGGAVWMGLPAVVLPVGVASGSVVACWLVSRHVLDSEWGRVTKALGSIRTSLRPQVQAAIAEMAAGGYTVASVAIVGGFASPAVTALFASGDRLFRASLVPLSAMANALQNRASTSQDRASAVLLAVCAPMLLVGVGGSIFITLFGPMVSRSLFGQQFAVPAPAAAAYGVAFLAVAMNSTLGRHILAPRQRFDVVLTATLAGAVVGGPAIAIGAAEGGVTGAVFGLALGELVVATAMGAQIMSGWPRSRRSG
ncbi:MAG: hypothetical protein OSB43_02130 [Nocardioides sp.]|uniref:lipopolysaccharide biosynthesis protein n=1 Tax=Nocardioides sp. TaxID=35761 RepID=UPI0023A0D180|nr:hypothetical protein [Nocardioides sp.]MDE0775060.1 hypothetical protein [Nocardioides sp.]